MCLFLSNFFRYILLTLPATDILAFCLLCKKKVQKPCILAKEQEFWNGDAIQQMTALLLSYFNLRHPVYFKRYYKKHNRVLKIAQCLACPETTSYVTLLTMGKCRVNP